MIARVNQIHPLPRGFRFRPCDPRRAASFGGGIQRCADGWYEIVRKGQAFPAGELLEIHQSAVKLLGPAIFRRLFCVESGEIAPGVSMSTGAEEALDSDPQADLMAAIVDLKPADFDKRWGKPMLAPLKKKLGRDIAGPERDEAWTKLKTDDAAGNPSLADD